MNWEEYKKKFIERNELTKRFSESELNEKLNYAKNLHNNKMPIIYNVDHLSRLIGVSYSEIYKITNSESKYYYKEFKLKKKSGGFRKIKAPLPTLNIIQKWIFENILQNTKASIYCKSYSKGVSLKDNAKFHRRQNIVLKLDIANFFDEISYEVVYKLFKDFGYSNEIVIVLARLVMYTNNKITKGIPQGASTSPIISNLILKKFDNEIASICLKENIRYTRYADDLTFSGDFEVTFIEEIIKEKLRLLGLKLNAKKRKILHKNNRQIVTGIVVNEKLQAPRKYRKNLRLELYYILNHSKNHFNKNGLYNHDARKNYLITVLGKVNYVLQINPQDSEFIDFKKKLYKLLTTQF
ncbi:reverse transcriptase family protein [Ruoffia tabacinasalis]|uniref:RNA-directed DNA polymerase n=1 Tax=Ruoffia tabacinasalis TaxID=87458 RepID=A0ABS0LLL9_9LACT|nr:reverse transcriptase domain-containing protein [Ruoffia tabacinasalis]MBG9979128.1 RNA-directed DNA polymerase [Ruoffia tabacinasalis]